MRGLGAAGWVNQTAGDRVILYIAKVLEKVFGGLLDAIIVLVGFSSVALGPSGKQPRRRL